MVHHNVCLFHCSNLMVGFFHFLFFNWNKNGGQRRRIIWVSQGRHPSSWHGEWSMAFLLTFCPTSPHPHADTFIKWSTLEKISNFPHILGIFLNIMLPIWVHIWYCSWVNNAHHCVLILCLFMDRRATFIHLKCGHDLCYLLKWFCVSRWIQSNIYKSKVFILSSLFNPMIVLTVHARNTIFTSLKKKGLAKLWTMKRG